MLSLRTVLCFILGSVAATITDCGQGHSLFKFTELSLTPDPPISGQNILMTVQFENPGLPIYSGFVSTSITLNGLPFTPTVEDLCTNTQCPLISGFNDRSTSSTWPSISGKLQSHIIWTDLNGQQLLCIDITEKTFRLRGTHKKHITNTHNHTHNHTHIQPTSPIVLSNSTALVSYGLKQQVQQSQETQQIQETQQTQLHEDNTHICMYRNDTSIFDAYYSLQRLWSGSRALILIENKNDEL